MAIRQCWAGSEPSVVAVRDSIPNGIAAATQWENQDWKEGWGPAKRECGDWVVHRDVLGVTLCDPDDRIMCYRIERAP